MVGMNQHEMNSRESLAVHCYIHIWNLMKGGKRSQRKERFMLLDADVSKTYVYYTYNDFN